jgi:hypothetical protein
MAVLQMQSKVVCTRSCSVLVHRVLLRAAVITMATAGSASAKPVSRYPPKTQVGPVSAVLACWLVYPNDQWTATSLRLPCTQLVTEVVA